ncbi:MAG: PAS domain-containing protein [Zetaproteobacteria bacterium]|nr:PAS domain-containing protein [Zetaproteobacteria bacterium]
MSKHGKKDEEDINLAQMLASVQSLHASHEITVELERSKYQAEQVNDSLPIGYVIVTDSGRILKANRSMARIFGVTHEVLIQRNLSEIFAESEWQTFLQKMRSLGPHSRKNEALEFELDIISAEGKTQTVQWNLRSLGDIKGNFHCLYQVLCQDISVEREHEKMLQDMLMAVPLGLLWVDASGCILPHHSRYAAQLLQVENLVGMQIEQLLQDEDLPVARGAVPSCGVSAMMQLFGASEEVVRHRLSECVHQVRVRSAKSLSSSLLHITYEPSFCEGKLCRWMLVLSPQPYALGAEDKITQLTEKEVKLVERALEFKGADIGKMNRSLLELECLITDIHAKFYHQVQDLTAVRVSVQKVVQVAKAAGLMNLTRAADYLLSWVQDRKVESSVVAHENQRQALVDLVSEIEYLIMIHMVVRKNSPELIESGKSPSDEINHLVDSELIPFLEQVTGPAKKSAREMLYRIRQSGLLTVSLESLSDILHTHVDKVCAGGSSGMGLSVKVADSRLSRQNLATLSEILIRVLDMALKLRGCDSSCVSGQQNRVEVFVDQDAQQVFHVTVQDHGGFLCMQNLKSEVVAQGLVSREELLQYKDEKVFQILFFPEIKEGKKIPFMGRYTRPNGVDGGERDFVLSFDLCFDF